MNKIKTSTSVISLVLLCSTLQVVAQRPPNPLEKLYSPEYHYFPSIDPTGLFYFGDHYFLNWGAAKSRDLVHWKMTPYGIERSRRGRPQQGAPPPVITGLSGSAVVDWNNTSGLGKNGIPPIVVMNLSSDGMHVAYSSDSAKTWIRHDKLAVMNNNSGTYRDPKVFWYEPQRKWVMVMPWCEIQEIRFFTSSNLLDWKYESRFGPWGAVEGQWECVDFFPLPLNGDATKIKWVLKISLQPRNGQYFVGEFDGKRFTLDPEFMTALSYDRYFPEGEMLFDFERGIDAWQMEGDAFLSNPSMEEGVNGKQGSRTIKSDPLGTGKITSPTFSINKRYINFLIGGGNFPDEESVNLLVDGKVVRTQTGHSGNAHVEWRGWDVTEYIGKTAQIEIVDKKSAASWLQKAYIYCDAIMLSDELPQPNHRVHNQGWERAFWVDWGADFYAARAWPSVAPGEKRTIWAGWMGSWKYFNEPILGNYSVPRSLELKTFPEGIRLTQQPIKELESLRKVQKDAGENTFEGAWIPKKFTPSKNSYELIVEFENISAEEFGLKLGVGGENKTIVQYSTTTEELSVDRRHSGLNDFSTIFAGINRGPLKKRTNTLKLHIFVDKCSIEVFGNDGETVLSSKIYPDPTSVGIELFSSKGKVKVKSLKLWELGSVNLID